MKPGLYPRLPEGDYHGDPVGDAPSLSASSANLLLTRSPRHAWENHPRLNPNWKPDEPSNRMDLGSAIHQLILEPSAERIAVLPAKFTDWRTADAKTQRANARAAGMIPLLNEDYLIAVAIRDAAYAQLRGSELAGVFDQGDAEITAVWQDEPPIGPTGALPAVWNRGRLDYLTADRRLIIDLKTTETSAHPDAFVRRIANDGMDLQAAFYKRGVKVLTGEDAKCVFLVIEVTPPYALSMVGMTPEWEAFAEHKRVRALQTWASCLASGNWHAYPNRVCYGTLPAWVEAAFMEQEARDE